MPNYIEESAFCPTCKAQRLVRRKGVSGFVQLIHLFLSVVTLGLWLFVWRTHAEGRELAGFRCATCGTKIHDPKASSAAAVATGAGAAGLRAALSRDTGRIERLVLGDSAAALEGTLGADELVHAVTTTARAGTTVLWVATDRRVLRAAGAEVEELPVVRDATATVGFVSGKVLLRTSGGVVELKGITPGERAERFAVAVKAVDRAPVPVLQPVAGWYVDPSDKSVLRYWDGRKWSEHTCAPPTGFTGASEPPPGRA